MRPYKYYNLADLYVLCTFGLLANIGGLILSGHVLAL